MSYENKTFPGSQPSSPYHYDDVEGITPDHFILTKDKMPEDQRTAALSELSSYLHKQKEHFLGYQANQKLDYAKTLSEYLDCHINNIGDPFAAGNFTVNCKFVERAVLDYFASLWNAHWPNERDPKVSGDEKFRESYWGYVLSMGSSEGNLYGLWNARDYLAGKYLLFDEDYTHRVRAAGRQGMKVPCISRLKNFSASPTPDRPNLYTPVSFYSRDTHYSIIKNMRILEISTFYEKAQENQLECPLQYPEDYPEDYSKEYLDKNNWPTEVPSNEDGSIYLPALTKLVEFFASMGYPILLIFNYGTTFKGAYDDVGAAVEQLVPIFKKYGLYEREVEYSPGKFDKRTGFWIHVDGALGAAYMPYLSKTKELPKFDFSINEVHSVSMSGHKWIGAPWPCGIYMSKVKYQIKPVSNPAYIGAPDTTFSGSRNGFSSLILWDFISRHSVADLTQRIERAEKIAEETLYKLQELERFRKEDLWVEYSPHALTLRFKKANPEITYKYSLSSESLYVKGEIRHYSHIFIMDSVTPELLDCLIEDLKEPNAFIDQYAMDRCLEENGTEEFISGAGLGFR